MALIARSRKPWLSARSLLPWKWTTVLGSTRIPQSSRRPRGCNGRRRASTEREYRSAIRDIRRSPSDELGVGRPSGLSGPGPRSRAAW